MKKVFTLRLRNGSEPFSEWLQRLEIREQAAIRAYIDRVAMGGGKKNVKPLAHGVFEVKIDRGPGYRVYFGQDGNEIILLLLGGDKGSQSRDIKLAKEYWRTYVQK